MLHLLGLSRKKKLSILPCFLYVSLHSNTHTCRMEGTEKAFDLESRPKHHLERHSWCFVFYLEKSASWWIKHLWKEFYDSWMGVWKLFSRLSCMPSWVSTFWGVKDLFLSYFYSVLTLWVERSWISNALQCGKDKGCSDTCVSESFPGTEAHSEILRWAWNWLMTFNTVKRINSHWPGIKVMLCQFLYASGKV